MKFWGRFRGSICDIYDHDPIAGTVKRSTPFSQRLRVQVFSSFSTQHEHSCFVQNCRLLITCRTERTLTTLRAARQTAARYHRFWHATSYPHAEETLLTSSCKHTEMSKRKESYIFDLFSPRTSKGFSPWGKSYISAIGFTTHFAWTSPNIPKQGTGFHCHASNSLPKSCDLNISTTVRTDFGSGVLTTHASIFWSIYNQIASQSQQQVSSSWLKLSTKRSFLWHAYICSFLSSTLV